ncbi:Ribosomal-protein-S18p-alanine acetyltransferase [hydrothermal vent metagenome]|uniref:Ribosomal-protein-S18p-alanine acetyltransferase n=1 Tax=hydrothermal vent metagenome TaxID=652676 RepID=A0A3B1B9J2_9ZZZZ
MQDSDVDEVMAIENLAYEFPWTIGSLRDSLRVGYCCWVYCLEQRIIGYSIMSIAVGEANILNLCIHPEMQGHGLGRNLLERMLTIARQHSADTAFLEVRASNKAAAALYNVMEFNEIGLRRNYYPAKHGREDAVLYAKAL